MANAKSNTKEKSTSKKKVEQEFVYTKAQTLNEATTKNKREVRSEDTVKLLLSRLNRVIGQIDGVKKMVNDQRYTTDLLIQMYASEKAMQSIRFMIFEDHLRNTITEKLKNDDEEIIWETIETIKKIL